MLEVVDIKSIDIKSHVLVPKFYKLSGEEINSLLERYNISAEQLPGISLKDPMALALDAKEGDIIGIARKSPTGKYKYYRRVTA